MLYPLSYEGGVPRRYHPASGRPGGAAVAPTGARAAIGASSVDLGEVLRVLPEVPKAAGSSLCHHAARLRAR